MSTVAKILVVVNLVLAGAFLASASAFLGNQDQWRKRHETDTAALKVDIDREKEKVARLTTQNATLTSQFQGVQDQLTKANNDATQFRTQNDVLKEAFNQASTQLTRATEALNEAQKTIAANRGLIDTLQAERTALADAKRAALEQKDAVTRQLNQKEVQMESLMGEKQALEARVEQLGNDLRSAELALQSVQSKVGPGLDVALDQPAHTGRVLDVDTKLGIAVISLGEEDGVKPGYRYTVSRGSNYVTIIEITDVSARQSAGRSIRDLQKSAPQKGDTVMSR
jgi:septal ring factor EnvC (AmiA/AmiB activator)